MTAASGTFFNNKILMYDLSFPENHFCRLKITFVEFIGHGQNCLANSGVPR